MITSKMATYAICLIAIHFWTDTLRALTLLPFRQRLNSYE